MFYLYSTECVLRNSYQVFELKEPIHLCYDDYFCYPIEQMESKTIRLCLSISKQKTRTSMDWHLFFENENLHM